MKIYTLLFGLLLPIQPSAQTVHDWENHHVLQINREPARYRIAGKNNTNSRISRLEELGQIERQNRD